MRCTLCEQPIDNHSPDMHTLRLTTDRVLEICDACARAILDWQAEKLARLFPTRALKRRFSNRPPRGDGEAGA